MVLFTDIYVLLVLIKLTTWRFYLMPVQQPVSFSFVFQSQPQPNWYPFVKSNRQIHINLQVEATNVLKKSTEMSCLMT